MKEEKIRNWVREKLDQGVDPERIKKSLENTGNDPSIVDELVEVKNAEETKIHAKSARDHKGRKPKKQTSPPPPKRESEIDENPQNPSNRRSEKHKNSKIRSLLVENWKAGSLGILALSGIISLWLVLPAVSMPDISLENTQNDGVEQNLGAEKPISNESETVSEEKGFNGTKIVLEDGSATPVRAAVSPEENVMFVNRESVTLNLDIRGSQTVIKPGGRYTTNFGSVTYYEAVSNEENVPDIQGSVSLK